MATTVKRKVSPEAESPEKSVALRSSQTKARREIKDRRLQSVLDRMAELRSAWEEYRKLDEEMKEQVRPQGVGTYRCGPWSLNVSGYESTQYKVPENVKAKYAVKTNILKVEVQW